MLSRLVRPDTTQSTCARCATRVPDGDRFAIVGTMSDRVRRFTIARSDIHLRHFGRLLCRTCAIHELSDAER